MSWSTTAGALPSLPSLALWLSGLTSGSAQINTGNELAVAAGFKPKSAFSQLLGRTFGSRISEYDFAGNKAQAVRQVTCY